VDEGGRQQRQCLLHRQGQHHQDRKTRKVWSMQSYARAQKTPEGKLYRSVKMLHVYACEEHTTTLLAQVYYPEAMGKGEPVENYKFENSTRKISCRTARSTARWQRLVKSIREMREVSRHHPRQANAHQHSENQHDQQAAEFGRTIIFLLRHVTSCKIGIAVVYSIHGLYRPRSFKNQRRVDRVRAPL
jgi:hypothetical protein